MKNRHIVLVAMIKFMALIALIVVVGEIISMRATIPNEHTVDVKEETYTEATTSPTPSMTPAIQSPVESLPPVESPPVQTSVRRPVKIVYKQIRVHKAPKVEETPCPITEDEYTLMAELMECEAEIVYSAGYRNGISPEARVSAVAWTVLNRLDAGHGKTIESIIKSPYQYAWYPGITAPEWAIKLAKDVGARWWKEHNGYTEVGRTIPPDFMWFYGDGSENYFSDQYKGGNIWDWSLPDPYANNYTILNSEITEGRAYDS